MNTKTIEEGQDYDFYVDAEEEKIPKSQKFVSRAAVAIVLGFILVFSIASIGTNEQEALTDEFAQCLSEYGAAMYGTEWCSHCQDTKKLFGDGFELINYVDCELNIDVCLDKAIEGYPTWIIDGQRYQGRASGEELANLTGCAL